MEPRVPVQGNKASKPLTEKFCGGCGSGRNSQLHGTVCWREPQGPRMYTNPPTWESAPICLWVAGEVTKNVQRAEETALFPLAPLPHIQCHKATWVAPPWQISKAPFLAL